jgi:exportin-7
LQTWWDTPAVTTSVLKCFNELSFNRGQRITFGSSSANGILLFREASNAIVAYGQRIGTVTPPPHEAYPLKFKGISTALSVFSHCLDGGYVNFGVFQLYGDPALTSAFDTILKLMLSLPSNEVLEHPKFAMQWLSFLTHAFRSHMETLVSLDTGSFMSLIQTLTQALDSVDTEIASQAAYSLDFFATYYVKNYKKMDSPAMNALRGHLAAQPMLFEALMKVVFQVVVFGDIGNAWALPRPLLSLILAAELVRPNCFDAFKNEVVAMQEEFVKLMKDITRSLDIVNRDRFQNRTTIFRVAVKEFAKVP